MASPAGVSPESSPGLGFGRGEGRGGHQGVPLARVHQVVPLEGRGRACGHGGDEARGGQRPDLAGITVRAREETREGAK